MGVLRKTKKMNRSAQRGWRRNQLSEIAEKVEQDHAEIAEE